MFWPYRGSALASIPLLDKDSNAELSCRSQNSLSLKNHRGTASKRVQGDGKAPTDLQHLHQPPSPDRQPFNPLQLNIPCSTPAQAGQGSRLLGSGVLHSPVAAFDNVTSVTGGVAAAPEAASRPDSADANSATIATCNSAAQMLPKHQALIMIVQAPDMLQAASPGHPLGSHIGNPASVTPSSLTQAAAAAAAWPSAEGLVSSSSVSAGANNGQSHWHLSAEGVSSALGCPADMSVVASDHLGFATQQLKRDQYLAATSAKDSLLDSKNQQLPDMLHFHTQSDMQPCVGFNPHTFATTGTSAQHQASQGIHPTSQQSFASGTVQCPPHEVLAVPANGRGHYEQQQHQVLSQHPSLIDDASGSPVSQNAAHPGHTPTWSAQLSTTRSPQSVRTQTQQLLQILRREQAVSHVHTGLADLPAGIPLTPVMPRDGLEESIWRLSSSKSKR